MREIIDIQFTEPLCLICKFNNGVVKKIDLTQISTGQVFSFLNDKTRHHHFVNKKYFIE